MFSEGFFSQVRFETYSFLIAGLVLLFTVLPCAAQDSPEDLAINGDTPWVISGKQSEPVERALEDVKTDWFKVFGRVPVIRESLPDSWTGPVIYLGESGDWRDAMVNEKDFNGTETFVLRVQKDAAGRSAIVATGVDMRGSIYAAYALSEEILGIDPWYYWVDKTPALHVRSDIKVPASYDLEVKPPTFKYRGWFINDEDLLNIHSPDPLRENIFSLEKFDRIYETILRLRGNMVVPATFPFPDERSQELASRRGLILNIHHILVAGLNTYQWPDDVPFSYRKHPEIMEEYWKTSIDALKDYEMVWTVGYRGKHDRPFWTAEPDFTTTEERGKVITEAIAKQVELIRAVQPDADIIANMWDEGANLYHEGVIDLPEDVILVWPDNGAGIIRDNGRAKKGDGIYYHTAMMHGGANQLTEMVNPGRIYDEMLRFVRKDATTFFLVNVSDVRPVPLSTDCTMKVAWDARPYVDKSNEENMHAFYQDWSRRQYGSELADAVADIHARYFDIPYMRRDTQRGEHHVQSQMRILHNYVMRSFGEDKSFPEDVITRCNNYYNFARTHKPYLLDLQDRAKPLLTQVPADRQDFYQSHVLTQIQIHLKLLTALEGYCESVLAYHEGNQEDAIIGAEKALQAYRDLMFELKKAEYGKWAGWYEGDTWIQVSHAYDLVRVLKARVSGESAPPTRIQRGWREVYEYQDAFADNFPLLYPSDKKHD